MKDKDIQHYFTKQEDDISNTYMHADGDSPASPTPPQPYKLFTQQYFIGIGVGMLLGYFLLPKLLKRK